MLSKPCLLYRALYLRLEKPVSVSRCSKGAPYNEHPVWACAAHGWLVQQRWHMVLFVAQNKRCHSTGGRRNLSTDGICTVRHGKIIQGLCDAAQMQDSQHLTGHKIYLLPIFLFLFSLIRMGILLCHLLPCFSC